MKIAFGACSARYEWVFTNIFLLLLHQRPKYLYLSTISTAFSPSVKEKECLTYIWLYITIFVLVMLIIRFQISQYLWNNSICACRFSANSEKRTMSSANRRYARYKSPILRPYLGFNYFLRSCRNSLKSLGLITPPCTTPYRLLIGLLIFPFHLTRLLDLWNIDLIVFRNFPPTLRCCSFTISASLFK